MAPNEEAKRPNEAHAPMRWRNKCDDHLAWNQKGDMQSIWPDPPSETKARSEQSEDGAVRETWLIPATAGMGLGIRVWCWS